MIFLPKIPETTLHTRVRCLGVLRWLCDSFTVQCGLHISTTGERSNRSENGIEGDHPAYQNVCVLFSQARHTILHMRIPRYHDVDVFHCTRSNSLVTQALQYHQSCQGWNWAKLRPGIVLAKGGAFVTLTDVPWLWLVRTWWGEVQNLFFFGKPSGVAIGAQGFESKGGQYSHFVKHTSASFRAWSNFGHKSLSTRPTASWGRCHMAEAANAWVQRRSKLLPVWSLTAICTLTRRKTQIPGLEDGKERWRLQRQPHCLLLFNVAQGCIGLLL